MSGPARLAVLISLCLLGAAAVWSAALAPPAGAGEAAPPAFALGSPPPDFQLPPLEVFEETVARPLFVRGRRPPGAPALSAAGTPLAPPPSAPRLSVAGIAIFGGRRSALVTVDGAAKPQSLAEGGKIAGWTVTAITHDRIRLEKGAEAFEAALRGFKNGT